MFTALALLLLTMATVAASFLPLGRWHVPVALAFAVAKAILVALFFMHARFSGRLTILVIMVALVWFGILMAGTMDDYLTRNWLNVPGH